MNYHNPNLKKNKIQNNICNDSVIMHCFSLFLKWRKYSYYCLLKKKLSNYCGNYVFKVYIFAVILRLQNNYLLHHFSLDVSRMSVMELKTLFSSKIV